MASKSSEENERTAVIENKTFGAVLYRQIVGVSQENSKLCRRRNASSTRYRCRIHQILF
jgi:hypothetical protein